MITKRIFKNVSFYFSASLIRAVISMAINPLIAMHMTHYDYALMGFYTSFNSLLLPLFSLMFGHYYNRQYFRLKTNKERDELGANLVSNMLVFNFFEIILVLIAFSIYAKLQNIEFPVFPYAIITFSSIIFNSINEFYFLKLRMRKKAKQFFLLSIYRVLLLVTSSIILVVVLKLGALGKLAAMCFAPLLLSFYLFPKLTKGIKISKDVFVDSLKFCWPLIIAGSSGYFLRGFDRALLVTIDDNVKLGLYNVAIAISGFLTMFQISLQQTFQPDIFEAVAKKKKKKIMVVVVGINLLNLIPIAIFILFAPFIIKLLTADRFTDAYTYARILALKNVTMALAYSITGVFVAYGYSFICMTSDVGGALVSIMLFKFLISKYGFYGAAWGQVLSYFCIIFIGIIVIIIKKRKRIKHMRDKFIKN